MRRLLMLVGLTLWLNACTLLPPLTNPQPEITPEAQPSEAAFAWTDELAVMQGICFEAAFDARGRVFVLRNEAELTNFFDLADNSRLCRRAVQRHSFDFSSGKILAGLWSYGHGCTARHDVVSIDQDDAARILTMQLQFVTEGTCNYELIRPFWIGLSGVSDYEIRFVVEAS